MNEGMREVMASVALPVMKMKAYVDAYQVVLSPPQRYFDNEMRATTPE
jgi:hypothetical protein